MDKLIDEQELETSEIIKKKRKVILSINPPS